MNAALRSFALTSQLGGMMMPPTYEPWSVAPRPVGFSPLQIGLAFDVGSSAPALDAGFYDAWTAMARRLGADPLEMAKVAFAETAMNPRAVDPRSDAGGLIGFMPAILAGLGWTGTPEEFRQLSATEQVPYVERYYRPYAGYLKNAGLVYVANFLPSRLRAAAAGDDGYVVSHSGDGYYEPNAVLDENHDGTITVGDLKTHIARSDVGSRYAAIASELKSRGAGGGDAPAYAGKFLSPAIVALLAAAGLGLWYLYLTNEGAKLRQRAEKTIDDYAARLA